MTRPGKCFFLGGFVSYQYENYERDIVLYIP